MSAQNTTPSERAALLGNIAPISQTVAVNTGLVAIKDFHRLLAVVKVGVIASSGVVNAKVQAAVGSGGSPVDITGAAITALTQAGSDSGKVALINVNLDKLAGEGYTHAQLVITPSVAAALISGELWGFDPRYAPASDSDNAVVDEIVTV
jgi:hypothetical protein